MCARRTLEYTRKLNEGKVATDQRPRPSDLTLVCTVCETATFVGCKNLVNGNGWARLKCRGCLKVRVSRSWHCTCRIPWNGCNVHSEIGFRCRKPTVQNKATLRATSNKVREYVLRNAKCISTCTLSVWRTQIQNAQVLNAAPSSTQMHPEPPTTCTEAFGVKIIPRVSQKPLGIIYTQCARAHRGPELRHSDVQAPFGPRSTPQRKESALRAAERGQWEHEQHASR